MFFKSLKNHQFLKSLKNKSVQFCNFGILQIFCKLSKVFEIFEKLNPLSFGVSGFFKSFKFQKVLEIVEQLNPFLRFQEFQIIITPKSFKQMKNP